MIMSSLYATENENRKLDTEEIVSLWSEFLNAGTDTTSAVLQWMMVNLGNHSDIQENLYKEIKKGAAGRTSEKYNTIQEDDLHKMPYLKAVILEGLRRHLPLHFGLSHAAKEDVILEVYVVPKEASVNFEVAEIGRYLKMWDNPGFQTGLIPC